MSERMACGCEVRDIPGGRELTWAPGEGISYEVVESCRMHEDAARTAILAIEAEAYKAGRDGLDLGPTAQWLASRLAGLMAPRDRDRRQGWEAAVREAIRLATPEGTPDAR